MAMHFSPDVVNSGLVFNFDANSVRSYTGPTIQNLATTIVPNGVTDTNIQYTTGYEEVTIPTLGKLPAVAYVDGYNSNSASYCCMQQFYFVDGNGYVACSGSTTYTYSIVYKVTSGYSHPNFMYRYENTSGGAYVGEAGVHDDAKRVHLGNGWYWAWNTFTTNATTARLYLRCFYYQYNVSDRFYLASVMVTPGDYTGLHPRLWPRLNTTKSNTQAIVDPVGKNTITATSLTYAANGSFSFNGSNNYVVVTNNSLLQLPTTLTLEAWVKPTSSSGLGNILSKNENNGYRFRVQNEVLWSYSNGNGLTGGSVPNGQWAHVAVTMGPAGLTNYVNGVATATTATAYTPANVVNGDLFVGAYGIGSELFHGSISLGRIYNRVLTAAELLQNFNAHRGSYGI